MINATNLSTQILANDCFRPDTVVILLRSNRCGERVHSRGDHVCLTRKDVEEGSMLCGVRADAVIILDPTLPEDLKREVFLPLLAATVKVKKAHDSRP